LNTFINLNGSDTTRPQIKADLSKLMDKLTDWKKLLNRLKTDIIDILKVDNDMLNNNNIIFI